MGTRCAAPSDGRPQNITLPKTHESLCTSSRTNSVWTPKVASPPPPPPHDAIGMVPSGLDVTFIWWGTSFRLAANAESFNGWRNKARIPHQRIRGPRAAGLLGACLTQDEARSRLLHAGHRRRTNGIKSSLAGGVVRNTKRPLPLAASFTMICAVGLRTPSRKPKD